MQNLLSLNFDPSKNFFTEYIIKFFQHHVRKNFIGFLVNKYLNKLEIVILYYYTIFLYFHLELKIDKFLYSFYILF